MTHTTNHPQTFASGLMSGVARLLGGIGDFIIRIGEANPRLKLAQRLNAMSDEELAARGLKREDIGRHVFGDMFYT